MREAYRLPFFIFWLLTFLTLLLNDLIVLLQLLLLLAVVLLGLGLSVLLLLAVEARVVLHLCLFENLLEGSVLVNERVYIFVLWHGHGFNWLKWPPEIDGSQYERK